MLGLKPECLASVSGSVPPRVLSVDAYNRANVVLPEKKRPKRKEEPLSLALLTGSGPEVHTVRVTENEELGRGTGQPIPVTR